METKLARISQLSKENPDMVFTSLGHLINKEMLKSCHIRMDGTKAVGIDGITKEEYGRNLEENINALIECLKKKSYKPKPARLVEIPKDNGKMRPLSIYCYEDKLVQEALRRILEAVFEPMFYDEMMGFRPNRGYWIKPRGRKEPSDRVRALCKRKMQKSRNETRHFYFLRFYTLLFQK